LNSFKEIKDKIYGEEGKIVVTSHVNPDGDAIGAGLALTLALEKIGKSVRFVLQDKYPDNVKFLNQIEKAEVYDENTQYNPNLIICVDSATADRVGDTQKLFKDNFIINLDHHISNPAYGDMNYIVNISSTSELIFNFLKFCEIELDVDMAEALYTGLVNDTGNFSHDNTTFHTFEMATELKKIGANSSKVVREFFNTKSLPAIKLLGKAMYEMEYDSDKKLVYHFISQEDLQKYNGKKEDTEGIVEKLISFKDAEVSLFLREDKPGVIKGSMRSKHDVDVNRIASIFGGGGHIKAAGFTSELPHTEIIKIVLNEL
jgi:phosphoesterase RecJ-like protein